MFDVSMTVIGLSRRTSPRRTLAAMAPSSLVFQPRGDVPRVIAETERPVAPSCRIQVRSDI
jgi:hypothetical protein